MARLIVFIVIFALFLAFIVLNLENRCDISLGFITLEAVPVFLSSLSSFIVGMLITIPVVFFRKRKRQKALPPAQSGKGETSTGPEKINKEGSPYGID